MKCLLPTLIAFIFTAPVFAQPLNDVPKTLSLFPEGSTAMQERDMAISPDGSLMFYTLQGNQHAFSVIVFRTRNKDLTWSAPAVASFSGKYSDLEPAFTSDGRRLFFSSNRPLNNQSTPKDYDIWFVEKEGNGWGEPKNVGEGVNTSGNEFYPSVTQSGNLYFTAAYEHGVGKEDIFVSEFKDNKYQKGIALDTAVNSKRWEFNAFVSPDEKMIVFTSYGRQGELGGGDLYISLKDDQGKWKPAKPITILNSDKLDYCPFVSFDQQAFFFTSARHDIPASFENAITYQELMKLNSSGKNASENIFWISLKSVLDQVK
jgi:Tol biopolymer transport system component